MADSPQFNNSQSLERALDAIARAIQSLRVKTFQGTILTRTNSQAVATATLVAILFDNEVADSDGYHSTSSNTSRITVPTEGKYLFTTSIAFSTNNVGLRFVWFVKNGTTAERRAAISANATIGDVTFLTTATTMYLQANDYVEVYVYQSSGGSLNAQGDASAVGSTSFTCTKVGD